MDVIRCSCSISATLSIWFHDRPMSPQAAALILAAAIMEGGFMANLKSEKKNE